MKKYLIYSVYGVFSWLIPFVISIFFYSRDGGLVIDVFLFKSIMIVSGSLTSMVLIPLTFKHIQRSVMKEALVIGGLWMVINWGLDGLILLPMSGQTLLEYFAQIGLRYVVIGITWVTVARVAQLSERNS